MMIPNPGSKEALEQGCTCPVLDNEYGEGAYIDEDGKPQFWMSADCPLHGGLLQDVAVSA
jgi:hypothetical protein